MNGEDTNNDGASEEAAFWGSYRYKLQTKSMKSEFVMSYMMEQVKEVRVATDPLVKVACLYTFKALFEKAPQPKSMVLCFRSGFLSFLSEILFSRVDSEHPKSVKRLPLLDETLVRLVSRYTDIGGRFFQFSPRFVETLHHRLCDSADDSDPPGIRLLRRQRVSAVPLSQTIWDDILFYQPGYRPLRETTVASLHQCSLTLPDLSPPRRNKKPASQSLADQLIAEGLAWRSIPQSPAGREKPAGKSKEEQSSPELEDGEESGADWSLEDVVFLHSIGGQYFWAYVGDFAHVTETLESISEMLRAELPALRKASQPRVGDEVIMVVEEEGEEERGLEGRRRRSRQQGGGMPASLVVMRGRVMEVGGEEATVLAVDYGTVRKVKVGHDMYKMFSSSSSSSSVSGSSRLRRQHLLSMTPQAKMCCLAGVHPPPADEATVELAVAYLTNVTKYYNEVVPVGIYVRDAGAVDSLWRLLAVAPLHTRLGVLRLVSNLSSISRMSKTVDWTPYVRLLLEILESMGSRRREEEAQLRNMLVVTIYALTNIMYGKAKYKCLFFQLNGQYVVLNVIHQHKCTYAIVKAASSLLRTVFSGLIKSLPRNLHKVTCDISTTSDFSGESEGEEKEDEVESPDCKAEKMPLEKPNQQDTSSSPASEELSDEETSSKMAAGLRSRHLMKQEAQKLRRRAWKDQDRRPEKCPHARGENCEAKEDEATADKDGGSDSNSDSSVMSLPGRDSPPGPEEPTDPLELFAESTLTSDLGEEEAVHCYEFNNYAPFQEGMTHHFMDMQNMSSITAEQLTELINGMLNSEGGTIHIGVTKQGVVRGLRVNRHDREFLRLAVDEVMARTTPVISHSLVDLQYVGIKRRLQTDVYYDVYVPEILVKPPIEKVFYVVDKGKVCHQRCGTKTYKLTEQDVREMVVTEEEGKYLPIIAGLQKRVQQLRKELGQLH